MEDETDNEKKVKIETVYTVFRKGKRAGVFFYMEDAKLKQSTIEGVTQIKLEKAVIFDKNLVIVKSGVLKLQTFSEDEAAEIAKNRALRKLTKGERQLLGLEPHPTTE